MAFEAEQGHGVTKDTFLAPFAEAFIRSFTPDTIKKSFEVTGLYPLNAYAIDPEALAPSRQHSTSAFLPVEPSTPTKRVVATLSAVHTMIDDFPLDGKAAYILYTPRHTRTIPVDPVLLESAALVTAIKDSSSSGHLLTRTQTLTSDDPSLPEPFLKPIPPPSPRTSRLLSRKPESHAELELQEALTRSRADLESLQTELHVEKVSAALNGTFATRLKTQAKAKERKGKEKTTNRRMDLDPLGLFVTSQEVLEDTRAREEVAKAEAAAAAANKQLREDQKEMKKAWKKQNQDRLVANNLERTRAKRDKEAYLNELKLAKKEKREPTLPKWKAATIIREHPKPWKFSTRKDAEEPVASGTSSVEVSAELGEEIDSDDSTDHENDDESSEDEAGDED